MCYNIKCSDIIPTVIYELMVTGDFDLVIKGLAMPVDLLIKFAQDYAENKYSHEIIKNVFLLTEKLEWLMSQRRKDICTIYLK